MGRGRKPAKKLSYRDQQIVERYNSMHETMPNLAKKYRISKQRVYEILMRAKRFGYVINRPKDLIRNHQINQCEICEKIINLSKKEEFLTKRQLAQMLNIEYSTCHWHLNELIKRGAVSKQFASLRSENLAKAIQYYKLHPFSPSEIGRKFGYKNFYSILNYQKKKGLNVERAITFPKEINLHQEEQRGLYTNMS